MLVKAPIQNQITSKLHPFFKKSKLKQFQKNKNKNFPQSNFTKRNANVALSVGKKKKRKEEIPLNMRKVNSE